MKIAKNTGKYGLLLLAATAFGSPAFAAGPPQPNAMDNPLVQALILLMVLLALAIAILTNVVNGAASVFRDKLKAQREAEEKSTAAITSSLLIAGLLLSLTGMAQDTAAATTAITDTSINGLTPTTFYTIILVLAVEIVIIVALVYQLKFLMGIEKQAKAAVATVEVAKTTRSLSAWWEKINTSIAIEREKDIDLNHDYDGIRELDNNIPPWWKLAFVFTIVFGMVYLYRYHVAKSAPLQIEELQIAMEKADVETQAYLKLTASNVDENSVKLVDEAGIAAGKELFKANCVACHGPEGGGLVGPNLTDKYWIHGNDIKDVFKTIKYGWPDKGMRSWKEDLSPVQMAELASFVETLKGTNVAGGKEPQGVLLDETTGTKADSTMAAK